MKLKNIIVYFCLLLFVFSFINCTAVALAGELPLRSYYKTDYLNEDVVMKGLDPNVLFLLDTSTAMTFAPWGVMPNERDGRSISERANMLKDSTYGHGMRPPVIDGVEVTDIYSGTGISTSYSRYGRDLDESNNVIGDVDCYYTSDPNKPFLLTFRNRHLANYDKWINSNGSLSAPSFGTASNLPNSGVVGTLTGSDWTTAVADANEAYSMLRDYIPLRYIKDENGLWVVEPGSERPPVPIHLANQYLVPNDSRLYKMKLVLWRLTDQTNSNMFSRMNVAVAISYQDISTSLNAVSVATKNARPGAIEKHREYYGSTETFPYGNAAPYVTGQYANTRDIEGVLIDGAYMSQWSKRGVWIPLYQDRTAGDPIWNAISRSIMYVPFNKFYVQGADEKYNKTTQLDDFRSYISGYEHYKGIYSVVSPYRLVGAESRPVKDEFWASSLTLLSTAIYGGRNESEGLNFPFHRGKTITDSDRDLQPTGEHMIQFAVSPRTNAGSTRINTIFLDPSINTEGLPTGQAVGSVLDFFTPAASTIENGIDGVDFNNNTIGFFPVTGSCQQNWLIVFCAGSNAVPNYPPAEAVRKLFNRTQTMRGRRFDGSNWVEENYDMDSGVRTIVVGFLPDEKPDEEPEIRQVRADITEMAKAGDPILISGGVYADNPDATPEIANDVPGLVNAFNNVLKRIHVEKMGNGTVSLPAVIDNITDPDSRVVFGAAYKINPLDQWNGWLGKYILKDSGSVEQWEANRGMVNKGRERALYTSLGSLNANTLEIRNMDARILEQNADIPRDYSTRFRDWLLEFEHDSGAIESIGILGDMVNSGITVVGKPRHKALIDNSVINNRDAVVYIQTNRGVLHAINYMNGNEIWGFIPPNIFQYKLKNMKFDNDIWIDGNGLTRVRSNPMVLLDGMLIARDVEYQGIVRTLLTGYLGHGGNGFYTMDITEMDSSRKEPAFVWAIENARYDDDDGNPSVNQRMKRWGEAATGTANNYDYTDLGLTIVPGVYFTPVTGGADTIGVLPGGLGHKLGVGDSQGKAFYFFNPVNGFIMRKIDYNSNSSTGFEAPSGVKLGMGISPIIYQENADKKAIAFYTADSEGNVMQCNIEGATLQQWKMKSIFQLRTLGGGDPVAIPRKMILARSRNNYTWLLGGTSDLYAPGSNVADSKKLINKEQFMFGLNVNNLMESNQLNSGITPSNGNVRKMPYYSDGIPDKYGSYGVVYNNESDELGIKYGMDDYGWVLMLRPRIDAMAEAEYLSAEPYLMNNVLYIATFIPNAESVSEEACSEIGLGRLYAIDPSTGLSTIPGKPAITLENVKIAGISGNPRANSLILSVKELNPGAGNRELVGNFTRVLDIGNMSLFEVNAPGIMISDPDGDDPELNFEELTPHVQYWRERF